MNIVEVELRSDNLAETEKFYKAVLGLQAFSSTKERLCFSIGYSKLIFRKSEGLKPVYHFAVDVPNNRFMDAYHHIRRQVAIIPLPDGEPIADFTAWKAKSFYFFDNNGNIVECITRYPNKTISETPFGNGSYISLSEIGLVTNDVPQLAGRLYSEDGIAAYKRQPPADTFTVCGNDEGLFILVAKGREWYPTKARSQSFSTRVLFMSGGNVHHIVR
jgi:catechol 2,3-dioxygenase-like lactoylglutathione lyase family enzyme